MELNIGMIGYSFMGKAHSNGFRQVPAFFPELDVKPVLKVICGRDRDAVQDAAQTYGWEEWETDWEKVIARDDIDIVDICTPGNLHLPMALAALQAGKHVICEKPLANTLEEARELLAVAANASKKTMVAFNYRRVPAVALAQQLIAEGRIGKIYHWRAVYLQDWIIDPDFPLVWAVGKRQGRVRAARGFERAYHRPRAAPRRGYRQRGRRGYHVYQRTSHPRRGRRGVGREGRRHNGPRDCG